MNKKYATFRDMGFQLALYDNRIFRELSEEEKKSCKEIIYNDDIVFDKCKTLTENFSRNNNNRKLNFGRKKVNLNK
jgi:hypothetical protein